MGIKELIEEGKKAAINAAEDAIKEATPKVKQYAEELAKEAVDKAIPKAKELVDEAWKYTKDTAVPKAKELASEAAKYTKDTAIPKAKEFTKETAIPAAKQAFEITKEKTTEVVKTVTDKTSNLIDLNGDGKIDAQDMLVLLDNVYGQSINGIKNVSKPVKDICDEYLNRYKDPKIAAEHLVGSDIVKCTTSGFLTGFGGVITLPVTIPANVASVLYVQIRMIASVASLAGLDVNSDATQTLVYACLAGVSVADIVKQTGIKLGTKLGTSLVEKIPGKALTAINQKVGFRMLTKFGEKGVINLGKMVPVIGAIIGGGFDLVETKIISNRAIKQFFDGDFEVKENITEDAIDAEFKEIINEEMSKETK